MRPVCVRTHGRGRGKKKPPALSLVSVRASVLASVLLALSPLLLFLAMRTRVSAVAIDASLPMLSSPNSNEIFNGYDE